MINLILVLLWANKIIVENPFPNVLRRSRVVNVRERILNPLEVTIFSNTFPHLSIFRWRVKLCSWRPPKFIEFWRLQGYTAPTKASARIVRHQILHPLVRNFNNDLILSNLNYSCKDPLVLRYFFSSLSSLLRDIIHILAWNFFRWMPGCSHTPKRSHNRNKEIDTVSTASTGSLRHLGLFQNTY